MDFSKKTDLEINSWIKNHEENGGTAQPIYLKLLEERVRRAQNKQKLDFDQSLAHLKAAAQKQKCTTYGDLAKASGVDWSQARHQMNGPNGHLDLLLDLCHAQGLPLLTAICVNQGNVRDGELGADALAGFAAAASRLGLPIVEPLTFHHECRDKCWQWGRDHAAA